MSYQFTNGSPLHELVVVQYAKYMKRVLLYIGNVVAGFAISAVLYSVLYVTDTLVPLYEVLNAAFSTSVAQLFMVVGPALPFYSLNLLFRPYRESVRSRHFALPVWTLVAYAVGAYLVLFILPLPGWLDRLFLR
jgi:hypothetical protein